jgi:hypothetical protein
MAKVSPIRMSTSSVKTLQRASAAETSGDLWRAKEIVQGRISSHGFDVEVYAKMGDILVTMGDKLEAGKFFFLAGQQGGAHADSIRLYLDRYSRVSASAFRATFPSRFRSLPFDEVPNSVREELLRRGYSPEKLDRIGTKNNLKEPIGAPMFEYVGIGLFILFVMGVVNGGFQIIGWIKSWYGQL